MVPKLVIKCWPTAEMLEHHFSPAQYKPVHHRDFYFYLELKFGDEEVMPYVEGMLKNRNFRIRNAEILTDYLERTIKLMRIRIMYGSGQFDSTRQFDSSLFRPSVAEHKQNFRQDKSMKLIDFVLNSYFDLAAVDEPRAKSLFARWLRSNENLFKRIALHVLTEDENLDVEFARPLLLDGKNPGLWDRELNREMNRFLRKAGSRLPENLRNDIINSIHAGPTIG